jgi:hypothetical protein
MRAQELRRRRRCERSWRGSATNRMVGQGEEGGDAGADHGEGRRRDDRKET